MANTRSIYQNGRDHLINGSTSGPQSSINAHTIQTDAGRILCVADIRGNLSSIAELAKQTKASYVLHVGDFGFYDDESFGRMTEKTLKHVAQYSPILPEDIKQTITASTDPIKPRFAADPLQLSELPAYISGKATLPVPVYAISGACEDVRVLEGFRAGTYKVPNLHIVDESRSALINVGGIKLRILGLGGAVVLHKLFDNGEGRTTIAGGGGTMWTTMLQIGELLDTANRVFDPTEVRLFMTQACPAKEGVISQLAVALKSDFTISGGLHFRYSTSFNEFSVNPSMDHYCGKLATSRASFMDVWETVKSEVEPAVKQNESQKRQLDNALNMIMSMPASAQTPQYRAQKLDELAFKTTWGFNLCDASFGHTVLNCMGGRVAVEMQASGFNFSHRSKVPSGANPANQSQQYQSSAQAPPPPYNDPSALSSYSGQQSTTAPNSNAPAARPNNFGRPTSQNPVNPPRGAPTQQKASGAISQYVPPVPQQQAKPTVGVPSHANATTSATKATPTPQQDTQIAPQLQRNGTTPGDSSGVGASSPIARGPAVTDKPTNGLFVQNVKDEEQIKGLFSEEDQAKIKSIDIKGHAKPSGPYAFVKFATLEEAQAALDHQPAERKSTRPGRDRSLPLLKILMDRVPASLPERHFNRGAQWNSKENHNVGDASNSSTQNPGGYKTGSDSETARGGRGGGRGARGARGGPGRGGRGGGTGRGSHVASNSNGGSADGVKSGSEQTVRAAKDGPAKAAGSSLPATTPASAGTTSAAEAKK